MDPNAALPHTDRESVAMAECVFTSKDERRKTNRPESPLRLTGAMWQKDKLALILDGK